jgi:predicted ArsR family transcriptional regulator
MTRSSSGDLDRIAVLAEPVRRRLYEFVVAQRQPVDRATAAAGAGIGRPLAAFHLDRLAEAGLLDATFRRRSGRTGPGAGRPAKFYGRPAGRDLTITLPSRQYDLAAEILAEGVERGRGARARVIEAAREKGVQLAAASGDSAEPLPVLEVLEAQGYEPATEPDGVVRLRNCPFDALVDEHRDLTCGMNLAMLEGLTDGLDEHELVPRADPREGYCCVAFVPAAESPPAEATD